MYTCLRRNNNYKKKTGHSSVIYGNLYVCMYIASRSSVRCISKGIGSTRRRDDWRQKLQIIPIQSRQIDVVSSECFDISPTHIIYIMFMPLEIILPPPRQRITFEVRCGSLSRRSFYFSQLSDWIYFLARRTRRPVRPWEIRSAIFLALLVVRDDCSKRFFVVYD